MNDPSAYLVAPSAPDDSVGNGFVNPVDLFNYVSPSAWINAGIEKVTGTDIFGYFTDAVTGEWDAMWKFGDAMSNLADCLQDLASTSSTAPSIWTARGMATRLTRRTNTSPRLQRRSAANNSTYGRSSTTTTRPRWVPGSCPTSWATSCRLSPTSG
jgi:hypothetical protein